MMIGGLLPATGLAMMNRRPSAETPFGASGIDGLPSYSADGSQLVFMSLRETTDSQLFVMNADGSGAQRITPNNFREFFPRWSR